MVRHCARAARAARAAPATWTARATGGTATGEQARLEFLWAGAGRAPFTTTRGVGAEGEEEENKPAVASKLDLADRRPHILERLFTDNIPPDYDDEEERAALRVGRAWGASELRLKSFEDLHSLWFVLLRERNLLETERDRAKTEGVALANPARLKKVRKSMARLKTVLKERSIEYQKTKATDMS